MPLKYRPSPQGKKPKHQREAVVGSIKLYATTQIPVTLHPQGKINVPLFVCRTTARRPRAEPPSTPRGRYVRRQRAQSRPCVCASTVDRTRCLAGDSEKVKNMLLMLRRGPRFGHVLYAATHLRAGLPNIDVLACEEHHVSCALSYCLISL